MKIDYRVDRDKLEWQKPMPRPKLDEYTSYAVVDDYRPPVQCSARFAHKHSFGKRLLDVFFGSAELRAMWKHAEQCMQHQGHWEFPSQRTHISGYNDRWPVSAADTAPLNPAIPICAPGAHDWPQGAREPLYTQCGICGLRKADE